LAMIELPWQASGLYSCPGLDASASTETCPSSLQQNAGMITQTQTGTLYGWNVVGTAFVLAAFGWGVGGLRSTGLSERRQRGEGLAGAADIRRGHHPVPHRRDSGGQSAGTLRTLRHCNGDEGRRPCPCCRSLGMGGGEHTLAAVRRGFARRPGLG